LYSASRGASNALIVPLRYENMSFQSRSEAAGTPGWVPDSGAGTNLKVGAPVPWYGTKMRGGGICAGKKFGRALHFFGSNSTISCFGERFCDDQYSLVSFLFAVLLLTVPPRPAICKSGGTCPPYQWRRNRKGEGAFAPSLFGVGATNVKCLPPLSDLGHF